MQKTSDINVVETRTLPSPAELLAELPKTEAQADFVVRARRDIHRLIFTNDKRFLLIVGPIVKWRTRGTDTEFAFPDVPFGVFLAPAAMLVLLWGEPLIAWYVQRAFPT